ncbi:peptidase S41-like protein [Prosthecobacter fusiformis]|uniref:Peptidase S41-like protein n=1 Tax=Prosthecobacter fusiformis TaxID=48464 RepID=A0A4R7RXT9_9BACT|nr:S41 family peptidase [Prosthecobacter fusiformis]TDU69397.1 peptidase S41-like protein [Prosthecobacter fusiformis]
MKKMLACLLLAGTALAEDSSPQGVTALPEKVESVSQAAVQSAFQILRSEYIRGDDLTFDELNRAAFQGLLERMELGAELVSKVDAERPLMKRGVLSEMLTPEISYLRPLSFAEEEVPQLETQLKKNVQEKVPYLILDLRSPAPAGEFTTAAGMLNLFLPRGELLFKLKQVGREDAQLFIANRDPIWTQPLIVLVDAETCNLGETIAAVLQDRKQALVIGGKTRGATVRYETLPLDGQWLLRFASAEMLLSGDRALFRQGLQPDFPLDLPTASKRQIFDAAGPVKERLFDQSRIRYNEAALISRKNPELDSYIRRSAGEILTDDRPALRDTVLQRAVDMLSSHTHLHNNRLKWPTVKSRQPASTPPTVKKAQPVTPP